MPQKYGTSLCQILAIWARKFNKNLPLKIHVESRIR